MNQRQSSILQLILAGSNKMYKVQEIADRLEMSEKTIRNEFKAIDRWLSENSSAQLIRKRSHGVYVEASTDEKQRLMHLTSVMASEPEEMKEQVRLFEILKDIINENKKVTIQQLSERYFVSRNVIKQELVTIEKILGSSGLTLETRQNSGLKIEGDELKRREVLMKCLELILDNQVPGQDNYQGIFEFQEYAVVEKTIRDLNKALPYSLTDASINNLIIHTLIAIHRIKTGNIMRFSPEQLNLIKNKKEFSIIKSFLLPLQKAFTINFSEEETAYLTLRVSGSKIFSESAVSTAADSSNNFIDSYVHELIKWISEETSMSFSDDNNLLHGLHLHLQVTLHRLDYDLRVSNPLVDDIKKMYPYMFEQVFTAVSALEKEYNISLPEDEMAYITLHFQSAQERMLKKVSDYKRAVIVCSMGIGMSRLLQAKLEQTFETLLITRCVSADAFYEEIEEEAVDVVLTTIPLKTDLPLIQISPLLFEEDKKKIDSYLNAYHHGSRLPKLKQFIHKDFIFLKLKARTPEDVIKQLTESLYKSGNVKSSYSKSALKRERKSSTAIGGGIAIPHGSPEKVIDPVIVTAALETPIKWGNEMVSLVFLLANSFEESKTTKDIFSELSFLSENPEIVNKMAEQESVKDFLNYF